MPPTHGECFCERERARLSGAPGTGGLLRARGPGTPDQFPLTSVGIQMCGAPDQVPHTAQGIQM